MRFVLFDYTGWKLCFIHSCLDKTLDKNITNVYWRNQTHLAMFPLPYFMHKCVLSDGNA